MKSNKRQSIPTESQRVAQALPVEPPLHGGSAAPRHKTLYLVRHAKSSWTDMSLSDFDRPLNKRGLRVAPEMGKRLKRRNVRPDIIHCSPAERTRQTVELLLQHMGGSIDSVQFCEDLYEASVGDLLYIIRSIPDPCQSAMIIGHNPSMEWLVNQLTGEQLERMPTCAIATVEVGSKHWGNLGNGTSRLLDFDYPKRNKD